MKPIVALYSRVSTDEQKGNYSLPSQDRAMRKLAEEAGYRVVKEHVYVDDGFSGGELDRPALTRMRDAIRSGSVAAVVCHDPDRLARKLTITLLLVEEFEKASVPLLFVNGAVDSTPEGKLFLSMRGAFAEFEKLKFAERVARGRKEKAAQGRVNGGRASYGYRYEGKKQGKKGELVIASGEAEVVKRMFDLAEAGETLGEIARRLNADGVPPCAASFWTKTVVAGILRNPVYAGTQFYNRRTSAEPKKRRKPPLSGQSLLVILRG